MFSGYEIKRLEHFGKKGKFIIGLGAVLVLSCWTMAWVNFQQAHFLSSWDKLGLLPLLTSWSEGVELYGIYSGTYVQALQHLLNGLVDIVLGLIIIVFLLFYVREGTLQNKVLRVLKENKLLAG